MDFLKTSEGKNFIEHHWWHYKEVIPENILPTIPKPLCFLARPDSICVQIQEGDRTIHTSYFVGVDWINEKQAIYVEPKLNKDSNEQTNYIKLLFSTLNYPLDAYYTADLFEIKWEKPQIEIDDEQDLLTPLLVVQFLKIVREIVRKGLKKSYYKLEHNLYSKVKGKVLVSKTIKRNLLKNKQLYTFCGYDEFGWNGLENRLLKKALVFVQRYLPSIKNADAAKFTSDAFNFINPAFDFVSEEVNLNDIKHTKQNAFYKEYGEGLRLAKLILRRFGYNISNTQKKKILTPPFWIDMSKLFELWVLGKLREKYDNIIYQAAGKGVFPDFLLNCGDKKMIIDAKYKTKYISDYDISDIRQLSGYSRDEKILKKLGFTKKEWNSAVVDCLIIYPDQNVNEELFRNDETEIPGFIKFFKRPIRLPIIKDKLNS